MSFLILAAVGFEARGGTREHFKTSFLELNLQKHIFNKFQYAEKTPRLQELYENLTPEMWPVITVYFRVHTHTHTHTEGKINKVIYQRL